MSVASGLAVDILRRRSVSLTTIKRVFNTAGKSETISLCQSLFVLMTQDFDYNLII